MVEIIKWHKSKGHKTALLTNSPIVFVDFLKRYLNIDYNISSELEVKNGKFTGKFRKVCYKENKTNEFIKFVKENNVDVKNSYFYSDSFNDIGVLKRIGNPVAVNPDFRLGKYAKKKGWKIVKQ